MSIPRQHFMEHPRSLQHKIDSLLDGQAGQERQFESNLPLFVVILQFQDPSFHASMIAFSGKPGNRLCRHGDIC